MGLALLFPGQGAQHPQMLPWLHAHSRAAETLQLLTRQLGPDWRERLGEDDWLHANLVAQPLLTGLGIAAWRVLAPLVPRPAVVAGYSVGELAAFAVAGVFDDATAVQLARVRAQVMNDSAAGAQGGLMALQGPHALASAVAAGLPVAIRISAERVIVGGDVPALEAAAAAWRDSGLRCARLPIAVASHTPAMDAASVLLADRLAALDLRPPQLPVVCNFSGNAIRGTTALAAALAGQTAHTVRWDDCMDSIAERGVHCVLEVGPGSSLAAMWRERHPQIPARSIDEFRGTEGVRHWVMAQTGG